MKKIAVIGLGYVGLPLAVAFGKHRNVIGFDTKKSRIEQLRQSIDATLEVDAASLLAARYLHFSYEQADLKDVHIYISAVPTPVDDYKKPDLAPLISACKLIGKYLKPGDLAIFESTVYPGCTEEVCVPILERESGLRYNQDFHCGYTPERINPGDKDRRLSDVVKITSGSTPEAAERIDALYNTIVTAGTHRAPSMKVAEAAKVIENSQRDLNIAFVNELALIFERMGIDTREVLEAAGTKWNFLPFKPGLVGGHCIGVDPYYLTYKAESLGYHPQVILSGRRINDNMGVHIANQVIKLMARRGLPILDSDVLVLGITFKENCSDIRNSRVVDVVRELQSFGTRVDIYDPHANAEEVSREYGLTMTPALKEKYHAVILAVAHDEFQTLPWEQLSSAVVYDVKSFLLKKYITARL